VRFALAKNWFKPPMKVIDCTEAVIQHLENSFRKLSIKKKRKKKIPINANIYLF